MQAEFLSELPPGVNVVYLPPLPQLMCHPWIPGGAMPPDICTLLDGSVQRSLLPCWIVSEIKTYKNRHVSRTKTINRPGASMVVGPTIQHMRTTLRMRLLQGAVCVSDLFCSQKGPIQSLYPRRSLGRAENIRLEERDGGLLLAPFHCRLLPDVRLQR